MTIEATRVVSCMCGEATGERCAWSGPVGKTVVVEWMPEFRRASHEAAGNWGCYPHNGAMRLRVEYECADALRGSEEPYGVCSTECPLHGEDGPGEPPYAVLLTDMTMIETQSPRRRVALPTATASRRRDIQ